jgi:hypothetical protein
MEHQFYKVMTEDEMGCPCLELDGLELNEAQEYLERMEKFYPDGIFWIEYGVSPDMVGDEQGHRGYARHTADGWEDFYDTDEG